MINKCTTGGGGCQATKSAPQEISFISCKTLTYGGRK